MGSYIKNFSSFAATAILGGSLFTLYNEVKKQNPSPQFLSHVKKALAAASISGLVLLGCAYTSNQPSSANSLNTRVSDNLGILGGIALASGVIYRACKTPIGDNTVQVNGERSYALELLANSVIAKIGQRGYQIGVAVATAPLMFCLGHLATTTACAIVPAILRANPPASLMRCCHSITGVFTTPPPPS